MRKGFILTLTALSTAFLVTSAVALGPTVKPIPDVFIGPEAAVGAPAEPYQNMFRYSTALLLWDYVEPGVTTGDGSTSDTLYWAWAAKDATPSGPTGSFLNPSTADFHYSIIQESSVEALAIQPAGEVGDAGWVADINGILAAQGGALSDYSVANAGQLTFRNIRLSPPPDQDYPAPTAIGGLPAGYLDFQEATVYVSDGNTTPGTDQVNLVTLDAGPDYLSGGAVFELVADKSGDTSGFVSFKIATANATGAGATPDLNPSQVVMTNNAGTLTIGTPATNQSTDWYMYGKWSYVEPVQAGFIYKVQADVSIALASGATLTPSVIIGMNARSGNVTNPASGYGFTQFQAGAIGSTVETKNGYLVPTEAGNPAVEIDLLDQLDTWGGTLTANNIKVSRVDLQTVVDSATVLADLSTFTVANWAYFETNFGTGTTIPTFTHSTSDGASLFISAVTGSSVFQLGLASFEAPQVTTVAPGKLVVARFGITTSSADTAQLPTLYLVCEESPVQGVIMVDRDTAAGSGPSTSAKDYYVVLDSTSNALLRTYFRALAQSPNTNGNLTLNGLTIYQADMPSGP